MAKWVAQRDVTIQGVLYHPGDTVNTTGWASQALLAYTALGEIALVNEATTVSKTAAYTAVDEDVVLADATSGAFTVTVPVNGHVVVKKVDSSANVVTVAPASGTLDGAANTTLTTQYAHVRVIGDGTNVWVI